MSHHARTASAASDNPFDDDEDGAADVAGAASMRNAFAAASRTRAQSSASGTSAGRSGQTTWQPSAGGRRASAASASDQAAALAAVNAARGQAPAMHRFASASAEVSPRSDREPLLPQGGGRLSTSTSLSLLPDAKDMALAGKDKSGSGRERKASKLNPNDQNALYGIAGTLARVKTAVLNGIDKRTEHMERKLDRLAQTVRLDIEKRSRGCCGGSGASAAALADPEVTSVTIGSARGMHTSTASAPRRAMTPPPTGCCATSAPRRGQNGSSCTLL
jgi:hypothetical protein